MQYTTIVTLCAPAFAAAAMAGGGPVINEFVADHTGPDIREYLEVLGEPLTDYSDYWILEIEGDVHTAGRLDDTQRQVGMTDENGIWWSGYIGNPKDPSIGMENSSSTLILVRNFDGTQEGDTDLNGDGVMDTFFWDELVDCIAKKNSNRPARLYCETVLEITLPPFALLPETVGGASRIPNGRDTDAIGDWRRNDFQGEGLLDFSGDVDVAGGEVINTPGLPNRPSYIGELDLLDFQTWTDCVTGPNAGPYAAGCEIFDAERDDDVDLFDFMFVAQSFLP